MKRLSKGCFVRLESVWGKGVEKVGNKVRKHKKGTPLSESPLFGLGALLCGETLSVPVFCPP